MDGTMQGKIVIVTGANAGIGKATAAKLADKGATVVLACRSKERGESALDELSCVNGRCFALMHLDLADLDSIRAFAAAFAERYGRLDVLINNAGILGGRRATTKQGFEMAFGVNYLGAFLLTMLLLPLLEQSEQGRVVMMTSVALVFTICRMTSMPDMSGRWMSNNTRSAGMAACLASAARPSAATSTS